MYLKTAANVVKRKAEMKQTHQYKNELAYSATFVKQEENGSTLPFLYVLNKRQSDD